MDNHSRPIGSYGAWIIDIQEKMQAARLHGDQGEPPMRNSASIFRIPESIRGQSPEHYQPKVVAIGPYHRDDSNLEINDKEKWWFVDLFISERSLNLERWLHDMSSWEEEARNYYSEVVSMDSQNFLNMLLSDGCFLLIALEIVKVERKIKWPPKKIMLDVLLLENQIPFFVLVYLYYGTRTPESSPLFPEIGHRAFMTDTRFFSCPTIMVFYSILSMTFKDVLSVYPEQVHHLLHLFRLSVDPIKESRRSEYIEASEIPTIISSAIELKNESAVKFKKNNHAKGLLDIRFHNRVIEIPPMLHISNDSNALFLNLIAFEERKSNIKPCVTTYIAFLDSLMKKESDVELLERNGILLNKLPTKRDVIDFYNKSSPKVKFNSSSNYLAMIFVNVNRHHNKIWYRWYADLKLNYFSNPWVTLSVVAAAILLILSFLQTYYSILGYYHM